MEIGYYRVGEDYGWDQEKFSDPLMKVGGCAAVTACDSCIYFSRYFGVREAYPFDPEYVTEADYKNFAKIMKRYLHPRWGGIDRLETYIDGIYRYFHQTGNDRIQAKGLSGEMESDLAKSALKRQIDERIPVPCLILKHKDPRFEDFTWHWFMITGYEEKEDIFMIKAVSYGQWQWLDFKALWDTGYEQKGGLIIYEVKERTPRFYRGEQS